MRWILSDRADFQVVPVADRHYHRPKIGSPQFAPPGSCLVLKTAGATAFWIEMRIFKVNKRWLF